MRLSQKPIFMDIFLCGSLCYLPEPLCNSEIKITQSDTENTQSDTEVF